MNINYKFGPEGDMDIRFSGAFQAQVGIPFEKCSESVHLVFQLICHAVRQVQSAKELKWQLDKTEEIKSWEYPTPKPGEDLIKFYEKTKPILVTHQMTYAKYQVFAEERLVLTLREDSDCDYLIDYYCAEKDEWLDSFLDYAQNHCKRCGRL